MFKTALVACFTLMVSVAQGATFNVDRIVVQGLQRVSLGSVLAQLSVREGTLADDQDASRWLHEIYQTGFFYSVDISRDGGRLVIDVVERPAIETIEFDGNSSVPTTTLEAVFADVGLATGEIFSRSLLENIDLELEKQYGAQGRYNARVDTEVIPLTRNRVNVKMQISEGPVARIEQLQMVGNSVFSDAELLAIIQMQRTGSPHIWQWMTKRNQFAKAALTGDIQRLEDFYFDLGYLDFAVDSQQVSISENKAAISIALNISEGQAYSVAEVELTGDLKHLTAEIQALVRVKPGQIYSRTDVATDIRDITDLLGEYGYAFAQVRDVHQTDAPSQTVTVTYQVQLGSPVYVNRIIIQGNSATNDEVIRRELRQLERALVVNKNIRTSKSRLDRLGYFSQVSIKTQPIAGRNDLVDLVVSVVEAKDSQLSISGGYADGSGFFGELSVKQTNFFGRGVDFSASVNVNETTQNYQVSAENPFFTLDGVSLGADLYYKKSDYNQTTFSTYATNTVGGRLNLGYPLSENQRLNYGLGISRDELFINTANAPLEMTDFAPDYRNDYDIITGRVGWSYSTLNGTLKADDGASVRSNLEITMPPGNLRYYRISLAAQHFTNFAENLALRVHTDLGYGQGYGDSQLFPFYKNFYSGGARSVRGYRSGSLGPTGTGQSNSPVGGNIKLEYGAELLFPTPFATDQRAFRTALFVDAGNVYTDQCHADNSSCSNGVDLAEIRYSAGVDLTWITPIAPLSFSYAWPLNAQVSDYTTNFSFNIGISY